jgi:3-oxoacyl-[acyl-carrier-protein] synthase II
MIHPSFFQHIEMEIFIRSIGNISPQSTSENNYFAESFVENEGEFLASIEANYKDFIDAMARRRMGRILRRSVTAAIICLQNAGIEKPDAIITGTGLGSIEDTENFLLSVLQNDEKMLNPTCFIQSTYNSISTQIAMSLGCHGYNCTYVHRAFSFESALMDAMMLMQEGLSENPLVGGTDEMTLRHHGITGNNHYWKKKHLKNSSLLNEISEGTLAGEGTAFFLLGNENHPSNLARIAGISTFYRPLDETAVLTEISAFLNEKSVKPEEIDLFLSGTNGDNRYDGIYRQVHKNLLNHSVFGYYKHLCGEYFTSTAFAAWLGSIILRNQKIPGHMIISGTKNTSPKNILIYNQYRNIEHSLILLSAV